MAKKKRTYQTRTDITKLGLNLRKILNEKIRPEFGEMTLAEIGKKAGGMSMASTNNLLNGDGQPSLGAVALMAKAAGGKLVVTFEKGKK